MDEESLKEWLRNNLVIDVDLVNKYTKGDSVNIGLRFVGENYSFCSEYVYIPSEED